MRAIEFITEVGNTIMPYTAGSMPNTKVFSIRSLDLNVMIGDIEERDQFLIGFMVKNQNDLTHEGNQFQILSNVKNILEHELPNFKDKANSFYFFAKLDEPSRVKLYSKRVVPIISNILGNNFDISKTQVEKFGYEFEEYRWIKIASK